MGFAAPAGGNAAIEPGTRGPKPRGYATRALAVLITCALLPLLAWAQPQATPNANKPAVVPEEKNAPPKPAASPSDYAGAEACKTCHADIYTGWERGPHWQQTYKEGGIAKHGCEDCHGPASSHVADPSDTSKLFLFEKASAKEVNERCLTCHAGGTQHMNAINSLHSKNDVSCVSCHSPHHAAESEFLLVKSQPELCYGCHLQQKAQFEMPFHHRVNERLIQCSDCHNVHGTVGPKQVRTSSTQDAICFKCHIDKQGPFVYEHAPMDASPATSRTADRIRTC
jgi:DmsE family decaheme c-type cytochrome